MSGGYFSNQQYQIEDTASDSSPAPCSVPDDDWFPTADEAKEILAREGIDLTDLRAKVMRRLCDIKGHDWKLSWPLDPCEYTCERCGEKVLH